MTIVKFKLDIEKDLYNLWETANSELTYGTNFKKYLPLEIINLCKDKKFEKIKGKLRKTGKAIYIHKTTKININSLNNSWKNIEKEYFKRLEKITSQKFPFEKINGLLTTAPRCPYRPHWNPPAFYVPLFSNNFNSMLTAGHELMHIHLHNTEWWSNVEKELGNKKTHDLKEALTELLNLEFRNLWFMKDQGYPNHIKLRKYIKNQWKKGKDFEKLTKNCIKWIKRNGIK